MIANLMFGYSFAFLAVASPIRKPTVTIMSYPSVAKASMFFS